MQDLPSGADSPTTTPMPLISTVRNSTEDVIISVAAPPVLSLVIGGTTMDFVSSSTSAAQSAPSVSSTTLGKGVVTTSISAVSSDGITTPLPVPSSSSISSVGGGVSISSGTVGDTGARSRKDGGQKHIRLTCVPFPGRAAFPISVGSSTTSQVYHGAGALTMETMTNYASMSPPYAAVTSSSNSYAPGTTASNDGPNPSYTSQADIKRQIPRAAIIGIVLAFLFLWIGSVLLILRRRRILLRNDVGTTTTSSQNYQDDILTRHQSSLRHFTFGGRSKRLIPLDDDEEGALARPRFTELQGSTRAGKRLPSIIIPPSASKFYRRDRLSISSTSSTGSQYVLAQPRQTEVTQPLSDPFSPPMPLTPTESLISMRPRIPEITIQPPPSTRLTAYRRIDRVIPPIPPLPSSPPPLPPIPSGSPPRVSRDPRDPFKDPPSPLSP